MLVWVNCHPAFVLGLCLIGIYLFCAIIEFLFLANQSSKTEIGAFKLGRISFLAFALVLNATVTLCNPYGWGLYEYLGRYMFKNNAVLALSTEFLSPVFHGALQSSLLEMIFLLFIIGLAISKAKIALPDLLVYLFFAHLCLSAQRNMALYVIVALPIIARLYSQTIFSPAAGELYEKARLSWRTVIARFKNFDQGFTKDERLHSYHLLPILTFVLLLVLTLGGKKAFGFQLIQEQLDETNKPVSTLRVIKERHLDPRHGLVRDNWGGLIKYKLDYPVFIDDRLDFYGEDFYMDYIKMQAAEPGWQNILDKYHIDWVLMPKNDRLPQAMKTDNNWQLVAEDAVAALIIRKQSSNKFNIN